MTTTLGIDCSHWQNDKSTPKKMDFYTAKEAGAKFAFIKVSERGGIDQDFEYNWDNAKDAGIPRGGYHFLRWDLPATTQARVFCACLAGDPGELPPVADFEAPAKDGKYPSNAMLLQFLEEVESILGRRPMIYTSPGYWKSHANNKKTGFIDEYWSIYPLWIAHYGVSVPFVPAPWPSDSWLFWQYTATGNGPKYGAESKGIDLNLFNGSEFELDTLILKTTGKPIPPITPPAQEPPASDQYMQSQIDILAKHLKNVEDFLTGFKLPS